MIRRFPSALLALLLVLPLATVAQSIDPLQPTNEPIFAPLDGAAPDLALPAPTATRAADGRPGAAYWQNEADYRISVALDTTAHRLDGTVTVTYTNNSPMALPYLWLHLEQNLFSPDSRGAITNANSGRWRGAFDGGGFTLGEITASGGVAGTTVDDTRMRLDLARPVEASGGRVEVTIPYSFTIPEYGADRMGRLSTARGTVYEFAQWYPRVAVYDDIHGWNALPYLGQGEFYLDYGDYDLALTVPATMQVVATGELQNPEEVYTREQLARRERAMESATRVYIVSPDEVGTPAAHLTQTGMQTWRFHAENVRDAAWAASAAFIVDGAAANVPQASGEVNAVRIQSAYPHEGIGTPEAPGWEEATRYGRASILNNSRWFPYPYPAATSIAGVVGGMEYPMLQFSGVGARHTSLFGVVDHELGHNWFPMIVGSDERRYAWMDEGFNSFINIFSNRTFYDANEDTTIPGFGQADSTRIIRLTQSQAAADFLREPYAADQPALTYPDRIRREALGWLAYRKPAKGLLILREYVLGPERFDAAFETYIDRWAYKHPQPADFFRTMEDVSGEDLDWFWRGWFMSTDRYDAALPLASATEASAFARIENREGLVFPVTVEFAFADGSRQRLRVPVEAFFKGDTVDVSVPLRGRTLVSARLDPDQMLPDDDRSNDAADAQ